MLKIENYQKIKNRAAIFLHEFYNFVNLSPSFPIDVESMAKYLNYDLIFSKMEENVNAITDIIKHKIFISHKTNPYKNPAMRGRYNFTLAHEIGHIILHENIYLKAMESDKTKIIEQLLDNNDIEREADIFAAHLILPLDILKNVYQQNFGKKKIIIKNNKFYPTFAESALEYLKNVTGASEQTIIIALKELKIILIEH